MTYIAKDTQNDQDQDVTDGINHQQQSMFKKRKKILSDVESIQAYGSRRHIQKGKRQKTKDTQVQSGQLEKQKKKQSKTKQTNEHKIWQGKKTQEKELD